MANDWPFVLPMSAGEGCACSAAAMLMASSRGRADISGVLTSRAGMSMLASRLLFGAGNRHIRKLSDGLTSGWNSADLGSGLAAGSVYGRLLGCFGPNLFWSRLGKSFEVIKSINSVLVRIWSLGRLRRRWITPAEPPDGQVRRQGRFQADYPVQFPQTL